MIQRNEILTYFGITISLFLIVSIPAFISDNPDLSIPDRREQVTTTSTQSTTTSKTTSQTSSTFSPPDNQLPDTLFYLMGIIGVIFLFIIITRIRRYSSVSTREKSEIKTEAEGVFKLINARDAAFNILKQSLTTGSYTDSFIDAYQTLDKNLDYFREVARPKHITPREYAFSVREPIYRPSVFKFVKIFYDLRYGSHDAEKEDVLTFISALEYLFVNEIPINEINKLNEDFKKEMLNFKEFKIPNYFDPSKPRGGTL